MFFRSDFTRFGSLPVKHSKALTMRELDDVIAAIATPVGEGGISVIRASGRGALGVVDKVFRGSVHLQEVASHTVHFGHSVDRGGEVLDEVLVTVFRAPRSYTAEDVVEISCHGGLYVARKTLEAVIACGARPAEPGEFTKRAFLNGRIDLSQAEAVADLIQSRSELARRSSLLQLEGSLSREINALLDRLVSTCGLVELELDFIEEDISLTTTTGLEEEVRKIKCELQRLVDSFEYGRFCKEGIKVVLTGRPNAGKSSLLNALLNENRAIVTEVPGTTRDVIEESIILDGMLFRLADTAGVRQTEDVVEREGIQRTHQEIRRADVCLYVVDISGGEQDRDADFIEEVRLLRKGTIGIELVAATKTDLVKRAAEYLVYPGIKQFPVSAVTRVGIDGLSQGLIESCLSRQNGAVGCGVVLTNERHKEALEKAIQSLSLSLDSIQNGCNGEVLALDLKGAIESLGTIVGKVTTDDILDRIFTKFCIGK